MKCLVVMAPSSVVEVNVAEGDTILTVAKRAFPHADFTNCKLSNAGGLLGPEEAAVTLVTSDRIVISFAVIGHLPTPRIKKARRYLLNRGYEEVIGKGDHLRFRRPSGGYIQLNPDNRDPKHIDLASAKALAVEFNMRLSDLILNIGG